MDSYFQIVNKVLEQGTLKKNRTGIDALTIPGAMFEHDMEKGFPLLTTKKMPFKLISSELEFFIKGITNKNWLIERNNHIWDDWCSPDTVKYAHDEKTIQQMKDENELGPIYGWQWRHFGATYVSCNDTSAIDGIDQLKIVIEKLKSNHDDRRLIVTAWNPMDIDHMALPPCHYSFQLTVIEEKLNLLWNQRSVDVALGLPFNIASYALLLHLIAKETHLKEGKLIGFLGDTHIYSNHIPGILKQRDRTPYPLATITTSTFSDIFSWCYTDTVLSEYTSHPSLKFDIAI